MKRSDPLEFLKQAQKNKKLSARVLAAVERGNLVTAEEVLQIAGEFGFSFSRQQFEKAVKKDIAERFKGKNLSEAQAKPKKPRRPPRSSCARGCLSWTISFCPTGLP
jgi:hypothetical protein